MWKFHDDILIIIFYCSQRAGSSRDTLGFLALSFPFSSREKYNAEKKKNV